MYIYIYIRTLYDIIKSVRYFVLIRIFFFTGSFFNPIHSILDRRIYVFNLGMFLQKVIQPIIILAEPLQFLVSQAI